MSGIKPWLHRQSFVNGLGMRTKKFPEFEKKYRVELEHNQDAAQFAKHVKELLKTSNVTLLYGAKNETCNQAVVLKDWIMEK